MTVSYIGTLAKADPSDSSLSPDRVLQGRHPTKEHDAEVPLYDA